ncbi:MAG: DUF2851 family protein [Kiritimatiellia bacterium]
MKRGGMFREYFPASTLYAPGPLAPPHLAAEPPARGRSFDYTERHLQAVWYDPRWRPVELRSHRGEIITVETPGAWNLEAGPDFLGAALLVGPEKRRITGDVEIHIFPHGWRQHGHQRDRRYRKVCLHLTYFEGPLPGDELPPGALQAALRPLLKVDPGFAFEHIDVAAYPYAGRADIPPCRKVLSSWPVEARLQMLEAAGQERLRRKAERLSASMNEQGIDQTFYEGFMTALGYQHNKRPFAELAKLLPVETLRSVAGGDHEKAYAAMLGVSGLLPEELKDGWDAATRKLVRGCWDSWWKIRADLPETMARSAWRLSGIRPLNHPLRRMAAAAWLFTRHGDATKLLESWVAGEPGELITRLEASCAMPRDFYWIRRASLGGQPAKSDVALVGEDRWQVIALNLVIPLAAACGFDPRRVQGLMAALKPEGVNQIVRQTRHYLFGPDAPSVLWGSANRRQGVQQIFHDYCLGDRSRCADCAFPAFLKEGSKGLQST